VRTSSPGWSLKRVPSIPASRRTERASGRETAARQRPLQPTAAMTPRPGPAMLKNGRAVLSEERPPEGPKRTAPFSAKSSRIGAKSERSALLPRAR